MIVVIGHPGYRAEEGRRKDAAVGMATEIASAAAAEGRRVELAGKIGDDAAGDALVLALARQHVGHAALLRDAAHGTPLAVAPESAGESDDDADLIADSDEEPAGDRLVPADPTARPVLEAADIALALRYLTDYTTIVVADPLEPAAASAVADAATFAGSQLVVVSRPGMGVPEAFAPATVLEAPSSDSDGAFAAVVGRFAAALDQGTPVGEAFERAVAGAGWQPVES